MSKEIKLKDIEGSVKNPFMMELKGKMYLQPRANMVLAKGEIIVDKETGEIKSDGLLIGKQRIVDKSEFAKIYASEIGILFELSKPAINVFLYLIKVMDYDNKSYFNYAQEYDKIGYKAYTPAFKGIKELIQRDIIYPHKGSMFWWINPSVTCKGERFTKYIEYITRERLEEEQKLLKEHNIKYLTTDQQYKIDLAKKRLEKHYYNTGEVKTNSEEDYN